MPCINRIEKGEGRREKRFVNKFTGDAHTAKKTVSSLVFSIPLHSFSDLINHKRMAMLSDVLHMRIENATTVRAPYPAMKKDTMITDYDWSLDD
jgi:uncharacterized protein YceH (UPF0502 family)